MISIKRIGTLTVIGCVIQFGFIIGWVWIVKQDFFPSVKIGFAGLLGAASMAVLYPIVVHSNWRKTMIVCILLALSSVFIYQFLGFTVFPGLVKDIRVFSTYHFSITIMVFTLSLLGYAFLCIANYIVSRFADQIR